jgi:hypothetical protein
VILNKDEIKRMTKAVGTDLPLLIHLGEWLTHLNLFSDAQVYDILNFVKSGIENSGATLAIADGRWVSFTGNTVFLDTATGETLPELPVFAVTHIMCDITALKLRMEQRQGQKDATQRNRDTSAQTSDVGNISSAGTAGNSADVSTD